MQHLILDADYVAIHIMSDVINILLIVGANRHPPTERTWFQFTRHRAAPVPRPTCIHSPCTLSCNTLQLQRHLCCTICIAGIATDDGTVLPPGLPAFHNACTYHRQATDVHSSSRRPLHPGLHCLQADDNDRQLAQRRDLGRVEAGGIQPEESSGRGHVHGGLQNPPDWVIRISHRNTPVNGTFLKSTITTIT